MSLFGALFSGVSGLQAQSSAMGAIADNVTNVNTIGYKATRVNFQTLVTKQTSLTQFSPGGVQSAPRQEVDIQGLLQATTSATDIAISGGGFMIVNEAANPEEGDLFGYTRAGSFRVDEEGFLNNVGGFYMQGWPLEVFTGSANAVRVQVGNNVFQKSYRDTSGDTVLINDNIVDSRNLQPLNLQTIGGTASPTTSLAIGANLPSGDIVGDTRQTNSLIFDSLGNPHNLTVAYNKTASNEWNTRITQPAQSAVIQQNTQLDDVHFAAGRLDFIDDFTAPITGAMTFTAGPAATPQTFTITLANGGGDTNMNSPPTAAVIDTSARTLSQILDQIATELNTALEDANVFNTAPTPPGDFARRIAGENGLTFENVSTDSTLTFSAPTITDANGTNVVFQNAAAGYTVPAIDATRGWFTPGAPGTLNQNTITFNGNGTPSEFFGIDGTASPAPQHTLEIIWANGAENMQDGNTNSPAIEVFFGNYNTPDGLTQLSGEFSLNFLTQNGAKFGNFAGVSIGQDGIVTALFDNGVTRPVFQIPIATFTNPNGLESITGNVWTATDFSGNPTVREAGDAGAGTVNAAALEGSTVDLGSEFTRMITTQRAYSSAARVITTADELLDELVRIVR